MWDLPGPGLEPMSPALADGFLTAAPPGKPCSFLYAILTKLGLPAVLDVLNAEFSCTNCFLHLLHTYYLGLFFTELLSFLDFLPFTSWIVF